MGGIAKIKKNTVFTFVSYSTRIVANMLMLVGIARFYGSEAFGQFTTATAYFSLLCIFADYGMDLLLATEIARDRTRANELVEKFLPLKILFASFATCLLCFIATVLDFSVHTKAIMYVLSFGIIANAVTNFFIGLFKGHEIFHYETFVTFLQNILLLILLVCIGFTGLPLLYIAIAFVISRLCGTVTIVWQARHIVSLDSLHLTFQNLRKRLIEASPFGLQLIFGTLYFQLDTILLSLWADEIAVGMYQAVIKLVALPLAISEVIVQVLLPVCSRYHEESREKWLRACSLAGRMLMVMGLLFGLVSFFYANQIIALVYGEHGFESAIPILRIFAMILVIRFMAEIFPLLLTSGQQQRDRTRIVIWITFLNLGLNTYIIPRHGAFGAAVVSLITNTIASIWYYIAINHENRKAFRFYNGRVLVVCFLLFVVVGYLQLFQVSSVFIGGICAVLSLAILVSTIGFTKEERLLLLSFND